MSARTVRRKVITTTAAAGAAVATFLALAPPSHATFRGQNGRLVFEAPVGANHQLFTILRDGTGLTKITHFTDSGGTNAAWSKDGSRVVFTRHFDPGGPNEKIFLYTINADGTGAKALPKGGDLAVGPNWFPNGRRIVFLEIHSGKLKVINANGRGLRSAGIPGVGGDSLCFVGGPFGHDLKRITPWGGYADKIDCSPDSKQILYSAPEFGEPGGISSSVYTVKTDGTDVEQVTHDTGGAINDGADSWSPDGTKIAFTSNRTGTYQIYTVNPDGTDVKQLTDAADAHLAAWGSHP